jgi:hypothetical protein
VPPSPESDLANTGVQSNRNSNCIPLQAIPEDERPELTGKSPDQGKGMGGTPQTRIMFSQDRLKKLSNFGN